MFVVFTSGRLKSTKFELILSKMKYLPPGFNMKALEEGVKNKWRWEWLNEGDAQGEKWAQWLKKPDVKRIVFCDVCSKTINYKSNGKKA